MNTLQQILNMISRILGLSSSMRNTVSGIKREAGHVRNRKKEKENTVQPMQSEN